VLGHGPRHRRASAAPDQALTGFRTQPKRANPWAMKHLVQAGLFFAVFFAAVACGNTVIIEGGSGGDDASSSVGSGGGAVVSTVSSGSTSVTITTTTIGVVASSSSGGPDCFNAPDCQGCLCNVQPLGCQVYQQAIIDNIYCGMSCAADCADFCVNQQDLPAECDDCVNVELSQADIEAFIADCEMSPDCIAFATDVQQCN